MKSTTFFLLLFLQHGGLLLAQDSYILITSLYHELHELRQEEYLTCFEKNLNHPNIEHIHIFYDVSLDYITPEKNVILDTIIKSPVSISFVYGRPTFSACFNLANTLYTRKKIIIANADIFFNETLTKLNLVPLENTFIALTRWNVDRRGYLYPFEKERSQDTWIFQSPIRPFGKDSYKLGTLGCDSYIAYQAQQAGMHVINPAQTIQTCHLHKSQIRHYSSRYLSEPAIGIAITRLEDHLDQSCQR